MDAKARIDELVKSEDVVLFMKGSRSAPRCGFSARVVDILDEYLPQYRTVDVLSDPEVREGVKAYSSWPTIPQLYVKGEFVGGCDIVTEMQKSGELAKVLGAEVGEVTAPDVTVTAEAVAALKSFGGTDAKPVVRLEIGRDFEHQMDFDERRTDDVVVDRPDVTLLFDRASARRADGMRIDFVERADGGGFKIDNPNEPPRVKELEPRELKAWLDSGKPVELFDARMPEERAIAAIASSIALDDAGKKRLEQLDRDATLVFYCHHGMRSRGAAQHAIGMGFRHVHNLSGGIDAWSDRVDPSVPKY